MTTNTNEKAAGAINTNGLHTATNGADFPTTAAQGKATASQVARLALAGHAVHQGQRGDFTVCKYGLTKYCADSAELQAFAVKLGVNRD